MGVELLEQHLGAVHAGRGWRQRLAHPGRNRLLDQLQPGRPFDGLTFDSSGDLWVSNYNNSTLVELSASQLVGSGSPVPAVTLSPAAGAYYPYALAFDHTGDLWVLNYYNDSVVEFAPSQLSTGSPVANVALTSTATNLDEPLGLAFDPSGDLWVSTCERHTGRVHQ